MAMSISIYQFEAYKSTQTIYEPTYGLSQEHISLLYIRVRPILTKAARYILTFLHTYETVTQNNINR